MTVLHIHLFFVQYKKVFAQILVNKARGWIMNSELHNSFRKILILLVNFASASMLDFKSHTLYEWSAEFELPQVFLQNIA